MKKIFYLIGLVALLTSSITYAGIIYCPETVTCVNGGKDCHLSTIGAPWKESGEARGADHNGTYPFAGADADANGHMTACVYHQAGLVPGAPVHNMFFIAYQTGYVAALNVAGNNWTTSCINHGCRSNGNGASSCPFTNIPVVK